MKKQKKQLIILLVLLVLSIGAFYAITYLLNTVEKTQEISNILVFKNDVSTVSEVSYTANGTAVTLVKDNDNWILKDDQKFELDQDKAAEIVSYCTNLNAREAIETDSELSEYGLDNPSYTITYTLTDGTKGSYSIGDYFEIEGTYFAKVDGDDKIYKITNYYVDSLITEKESLAKQAEDEE